MRRIPFFLVAVAMLFTLANISLAQDRTFGARRLLLDDGTLTPAGLVYLTDQNGSLGVDNTGNVTGTFPSTCALLDLSSTTKGLLPPRMTGGQEAAICGGAPPFGMLVYNTSTNTLDLFSPTGWAPILGGQSWLLGGNNLLPAGGGLGPLQSFIGTNDASDFVIATAFVERARVIGVAGPNQGWMGINTINPGALLDVNGTLNSTGSSTIGTTAGTNNTFGNGGPGTSNTIGTNASFNTIGQGSSFNDISDFSFVNTFGNNSTQNDFGTNATFNNFGNFAGSSNNFGFNAPTNNIGGAGVSTNNMSGPTNINTTTNDATSIGSTSNASGVTIASNNATAITLNVASIANNLRLNNIAAGANTDAALLDITAVPSGNVRTRTIGSLITGSNGVEVTYPTASSADAHFATSNAGVVFANGRFINTGGQLLSITGNSGGAGTTFASLNGSNDAIGLNNNVTNNGTTTIGNTTAGGIVSINSSISTSRTSPTNSTLATGALGNTFTASAGQNTLTGQTGNTMTATTGNNTLGAAAVNALTGGTGNTVTATTGNNVLTTNGNGQNNLVANGAGGQNNLSANSATGQNNITANVAGGSNNIVGATNINNNQPFNTQISTGTSTGSTTIGSNVAGAISLQSNASTAISLNVTNVLNNLQFGNIAVGANTDAVFLDLTAATTGFVRTRTINSMITGSNGVEVTYPGTSLADAHLAANNNTVLFTSDRFINTDGFTFHVTSGTPGTDDLFNAGGSTVNVNNTVVGSTNIGNIAGSTNIIGLGASFNSFGTNGTTENDFGPSTTAANVLNFFGGNNNTGNTTNNLGVHIGGAGVNNNNIGSTNFATNTILGTTNINVTGGNTTNIATTTAATTNVGNATGGTNNIGNGGGATTNSIGNGGGTTSNSIGNGGGTTSNTIGNSANLNTIGTNAVNNVIGTGAGTNQLGSSATLNQVGANAGTNQFGNGATSNQFGINAPTNTIGTAGTSTNAINGTTNINTASAQLTTVGNGATGMHLLVNGTALDASLADGAGNSHWDFQVTGDAYISGRTRLVSDVLAGGQLTVTSGTTLNGGAVINLGLQVFNGTTLNNGTTINNLPSNPNDFMLTTPVTGGGIVSTRQVSTLPFVGGQIPIHTDNLAVAYAIVAADYLIICTNGAAGNVTLPAAAGATGKVYVVKQTNAQVTVGSAGGAIDGAANKVLNNANSQVAAFASDGVNWWVVSN